MNNKKGIIQVIVSITVGITSANIFAYKSLVVQFIYTILGVLVALSILELVYFLKKKKLR
ncbi:hypothetical protein Clocel_0745 [Clostridium cellulovorans 743B]|uniref:Uncharacterized protein n=1 Tax=Clostridium cellulovorans (strain ATCC 35296 / DSM 3052 / OCM 3 / 743B) TaxID=573061 RepID=D9SSB9_CLOC7|nr:hypothetical protein Clocel_0745 [Clostridium cellulovorans 743B]